MVYANDQWVLLPVVDIFDAGMMQLALNTAETLYNKGEERIKEFHKLYDDFYSPSPGWNKWYADNVTGPFNKGIEYLYKNGIDPIRSPEGRAYIQTLINRVPKEMLARAKSESAIMDAYIKNAAELDKKGLRNPEMDEFLQGGTTIANYNPEGDTPWQWYSPQPYLDINSLTSPWFKNQKPSFLYRGTIGSDGKPKIDKNGPYDFSGITVDALKQSIGENLDNFMNSPQGKYEVDKIKKKIESEGKTPTDEEIRSRLTNAILSANGDKLQLTKTPNQEWQAQQARSLAYARLRSSGGGGGGGYTIPGQQGGTSYARVLHKTGVQNILRYANNAHRAKFTDSRGVYNESGALVDAYDQRFIKGYNRTAKKHPIANAKTLINQFSFSANPTAIAYGLGIRPNGDGTFMPTVVTTSGMLNEYKLTHKMRHPGGLKMRNDSTITATAPNNKNYRFTGRVTGFIDTSNRFVEYAEVEQVGTTENNGSDAKLWYIKLPQESLPNSSAVNETTIWNNNAFDEQAYGPLNVSADAMSQDEIFYAVGEYPSSVYSQTIYP